MDIEHAKQMMDAFYEAKRIRDQLPALPDGVNASHINTLDAVMKLSAPDHAVRISDVAEYRKLPRPSVTRTVKEMERLGLIEKQPDEKDRRVVHLVMTARGRKLYQTYVEDYFRDLTERLSAVPDREVENMVRTIRNVEAALR